MIKVKNTFSTFASLKADPPKSLRITLLGIALILIMGAYESVRSSTSNAVKEVDKAPILHKAFQLQLPFLANQGQLHKDVSFYAHTFNGAFYLTGSGELIYSLAQTRRKSNKAKKISKLDKAKIWVLKETLLGAVIKNPRGFEKSQAKINYFIGSNSHKWKTNIPTYNSVSLGDIYTGIELKLKAYGKNVEKIFIVQPGADPENINIKLRGANALRINDAGELEVDTGFGVVRFSKPNAYQEKNGVKQSVQAAYNLNGDVYGFKAAEYDPSLPLIIDPCLAYSTYLGGTSDDIASDIAVNASGAVYLTGATYSTDFPTQSAGQPVNAGASDAFVTKLVPNPNGDTFGVAYSTYLGGSLNDFGYGIAADDSGNAVVTGETWSDDFPMAGAYDKKIGGGVDVWVARLLSDGTLHRSTYLGGGGGTEAGYAVALDLAPDNTANSAYITGVTQASNFPVTPGAAFTQSRGKVDVFVSRIDFSGPKCSLVYSTFLGGNGDDEGYGIALDDDTVFVTGITSSPDFYLQGTPLSSSLNGPTDGFLTTFSLDLQDVHYSTFIGGDGEDTCEDIALDIINSDIYVTGSTSSVVGFPGCASGCALGGLDAFVLKLDTGYNNPVSFNVGGTGDDVAYGIAIDIVGNIFVAGQTNSPDFPPIVDSAYAGGYDAFLTKLVPTGLSYTVASSTYFGGAYDDACYGLALDLAGNVYIAGSTHGFLGEESSDLDAFVVALWQVDNDNDGIADSCDNCPLVPNGPLLGTCTAPLDNKYLPIPCDDDTDCDSHGYCSKNQEDFDGDLAGDACDQDDDDDGLDDWWEARYFGSPTSAQGPNDDPDGEGLNNQEEFENYGEFDPEKGPDPTKPDTDSDGWTDLMEFQAGTDPNDNSSYPDASVFASGIIVDKNHPNASDKNLGNSHEEYPLESIHAGIDRLNLLETGSYTIHIYPIGAIYSVGDPEPDTPLATSQNVNIQATGVTLDGAGASNWKQALVFSPLSGDVTISGLTINNFNQGVVFSTDGGCAILNSVNISSCQTGLQIVEAYQLEVDLMNSQISNCQTGVEFAGEGSDNTVSNGSIQNNVLEAVKVSGGTGNQLVGADISGPGFYGLKIEMGVEDFTVSGGTIRNTEVGIGFATDGANLNVSGATIEGCGVGLEFLENYMTKVDLGESPNDTLITDCDVGILFRAGSSNNTVRNGSVSGNGDGIRFEACNEAPDDNQIINTIVSNNTENGIVIIAGSGNRLIDVQTTGSETGILMGPGSSYNVLSGGSVSDNGQNIVLDGSNNTVESLTLQTFGQVSGSGNELVDITLDGQSTEAYGLLLDQGSEELILKNVTIQNYDVGIGFATDAACVRFSGQTYIRYCRIGVDIRENYMLDIDLGSTVISNCDTGIEIAGGSSNNIIRNGVLENNTLDGILVDGCAETPDENKIIGTTVQNNGRNGIAILAGFDNEVIGCTLTGNNLDQMTGGYGGVTVMNGSGRVNKCRIYNNGCRGIYVDESAGVEISGNLIYGNPEGIRVSFINDVTIASNTITDNNGEGLVVEDGSSPMVLYNILYGNSTSDVLLEGDFEPANLIQNDIGTINQIDLPPTNISVDPMFTDSASHDYTLTSASLCIDGTDVTEPGVDLNDLSRPKGLAWDMGAFETSAFLDADDDGLSDVWEQQIVEQYGLEDITQVEPGIDYDGDGQTAQQEFEAGTDPTNPVYVGVTNPGSNPYYTDNSAISLDGISSNAGEITIQMDGISVETLNAPGLEAWNSTGPISLEPGENFIQVTATGNVNGQDYTATDNITVVRDSEIPAVSIVSPTSQATYTTALQSIILSGLTSDDTEIDSVSWALDGTGPFTATGTSNWTAGPISLQSGENVITITATDIFGNTGNAAIAVIQTTEDTGVSNVEEDLSSQGAEPTTPDPEDIDSDGYRNEDETECLSNPDNGQTSDLPNLPENWQYTNTGVPAEYPTNPSDPNYDETKIGYNWPDCLNPDDDFDDLPDWWEEQYFAGSPTSADPDFDDDGDGYTNLVEYQNGTNPVVAQTKAFDLKVLGGSDNDISDSYLPQYDLTVRIRATWTGADPAPGEAVFRLRMTTNYPGRAVNDPDPAITATNYPPWYDYSGYDFGLTTDPANHSYQQGPVVVSKSTVGDYYDIYLQSWDFGGRTNVLVTDPLSGTYIGQIWMPEGSNQNGVGSAWDIDNDANTPNPVDVNTMDPNTDTDAIIFENPGAYTAPLGDDFTVFEEYRGIVYTSQVGGGTLIHLRCNPYQKTLFVRGVGFDALTPLEIGNAFTNAGLQVVDLTNHGHDATEDGSLFIYIGDGTITEIAQDANGKRRVVRGVGTNWPTFLPKHEWEFKLDNDDEEAWIPIGYWASSDELVLDFEYPGGSGDAYSIRKPLPHMNVLLIRRDTQNTFVGQDGHVHFIAAIPPSQQNPTGTRYANWSTKGYAWCQTTSTQASMYGLAVSLEIPLFNYIHDKLYTDGTTWDGNGWIAPDTVLNPLSQIEDQTDQLAPIDGILGDGSNNTWDGDRRVSGYPSIQGHLSPFDTDADMHVELPLISDPTILDKFSRDYDNGIPLEYPIGEVRRHTNTHEISHALAGPSHTNDPTCLMYRYSNNWRRDGHLSDYYRSLLRVHNRTR